MSKLEKLLQKMRHNPRDWKIEDIKIIAKRYDIESTYKNLLCY